MTCSSTKVITTSSASLSNEGEMKAMNREMKSLHKDYKSHIGKNRGIHIVSLDSSSVIPFEFKL